MYVHSVYTMYINNNHFDNKILNVANIDFFKLKCMFSLSLFIKIIMSTQLSIQQNSFLKVLDKTITYMQKMTS